MTTYAKEYVDTEQRFGGVPYGNKTALVYDFETDSSGIVVGAAKTTAAVATDAFRMGILPAGMKLLDATFIVSNAFTALTVLDIGFEYVDGVDDTDVPQDVDYFGDAIVASSVATLRKVTTTAPVELPKDAYLLVTVAGATQDEVAKLTMIIDGILRGHK